jgi:hypothetical protein
MTWQPLLEGPWRDRALQGVEAIVDHLAPLTRDAAGDPTLAGGTSGLALLYAYQAQAQGGPEPVTAAIRCLEHAVAALSDTAAPASLYEGLTGVGWAVAHLADRLPGLDGKDDLAEIDGVLLDHLDRSPWPGSYELCDGLVGLGVYALERGPRPAAVACLERVVDRLAETAEQRPEGVTWASSGRWLVPELQAERPRPYYDLGLAHGVPGVIALLGRVCAAGVALAKARRLLEGAVHWLLNQQPAVSQTGFPAQIGPGLAAVPAPPEWCYGDPGIAAALLGAAHGVGEPRWERAALAIARRACLSQHSQVVQAGLYHGAAGLGHLYNRMFQATGEPWLATAARLWFRRTLEMRSPQGEAAGCFAWGPGPKDAPRTSVDNPRFLTGTTGIALALLAAATPVEPAWDRVLLVSIPPRSSPGRDRKEVLQCHHER